MPHQWIFENPSESDVGIHILGHIHLPAIWLFGCSPNYQAFDPSNPMYSPAPGAKFAVDWLQSAQEAGSTLDYFRWFCRTTPEIWQWSTIFPGNILPFWRDFVVILYFWTDPYDLYSVHIYIIGQCFVLMNQPHIPRQQVARTQKYASIRNCLKTERFGTSSV